MPSATGNQSRSSGQQMRDAPQGSQTMTIPRVEIPTLHLVPTDDKKKDKKKAKPRVTWQEDVIDNEHMNKKKTKICCIFHPQNEDEFEVEPDSDSSSSSSSSSDSDNDEPSKPNAYERQPRYKRKQPSGTPHSHDHGHGHAHDCGHSH
ncbi:unnamed protein product [Ambrosiozyma monospora]|uniref:Unnamed protein product n=1 Tax=Ambrosiozyma monospora TaxID=43982 RepID=A0ACB5T6A3_AMBMO|nr:unnamed protein product [Ambrosiozyma monospora]